jgi:hypothetical protein
MGVIVCLCTACGRDALDTMQAGPAGCYNLIQHVQNSGDLLRLRLKQQGSGNIDYNFPSAKGQVVTVGKINNHSPTMIFGFNTDVKVNDTVYHVQSEARENDFLLQTQIFIKGRCLGKRATSYAGHVIQPGYSIETMHELLKVQHKLLLEIVRAGGDFEALFNKEGDVFDAHGTGLLMRWMNSDVTCDGTVTKLKILVHGDEGPADGALLTARLFDEHGVNPDTPIHTQSATEEDGTGELEIDFSQSTLPEPAVLVRATYGDQAVTRKLRIKRAS